MCVLRRSQLCTLGVTSSRASAWSETFSVTGNRMRGVFEVPYPMSDTTYQWSGPSARVPGCRWYQIRCELSCLGDQSFPGLSVISPECSWSLRGFAAGTGLFLLVQCGRHSSSAPSLFPQLCCSGIPGSESTSQLCPHLGNSHISQPQRSAPPQQSKHGLPSLAPSHEVGLIHSSVHSCAQFHVSDIDKRPPESFRGKQPIQCCTWYFPTLPALLY